MFFLFKKHEGKPWIVFPEPPENRYSISALVEETTKKEEAVVKPAKILRRITARIPTKVTQKPPKKKEQIVSKPKLSTLRKPRFTVYGAKYMLTLGVDNHERTISYYHVFDSALGLEIAHSMGRLVPVTQVPKALSCTRPLVDQLLSERILTPVVSELSHAPGRTKKSIDTLEIDQLLRSMERRSMPVSELPAGMVDLATAAMKSKAPASE